MTSHELPTLWQAMCASSCHAYDECGSSPGAPCGCTFAGTDRAYLCDECWLNCRERRGSDLGDAGENHYCDGLALKDLRLTNTLLDLPPFIPAITRELPHHTRLPAVAAGMSDLFRRDPTVRIRISPRLEHPEEFRRELRCKGKGIVVGVLNGTDRALELFWNADHAVFARKLVAAGLTAITGPTFSVLGEHEVGPYHNLTMLRRHHRVVQRLFHCGLEVVPNLYWRTHGGLHAWANVLSGSNIHTVSRDFSRTRSGPQFQAHLDGLLEILKAVRRPMRVIVLGVGVRKAISVSSEIQSLGCSCTIVTADPIRLAINRGAEVFRRSSRELSIRVRPDLPREQLALRNVSALARELSRRTARPGRHRIKAALFVGR